HEAFQIAREGRPGPVLVDVPRDVQLEEAEFEFFETPAKADAPLSAPLSDEVLEEVQNAARLISEAKRPIIISGHGIIASGASQELKQLAEVTGIPVITTLLGLSGFPGNHPLSLGMLGMHGMYWSNMAVDQADVIVGLGMRFDDRVTGRVSTFAPHARIIHLDIERDQVGRNVPVEVPLVGDAKAVLKALVPLVKKAEVPDWIEHIETLKRDHPSLAIPNSDMLQAQHVFRDLNELLQENPESVVVTGVGQHQMWAAQFLFFDRCNSFVSSGGLGAMGFELPASMGVQAGLPNTSVWCIAGDGGFQMTLQELATVSEEKLPVKIALFNNGHLGMVRQWQEMYFQNNLKAVPFRVPTISSWPRPMVWGRFGLPTGRMSCPPCARPKNLRVPS
ncbi:MAG: acetolactate synthase large subunit, partial [Chloroflexi bacterium]|nr:acetolactate synthase large subunit [Chloroflexota bacterium]